MFADERSGGLVVGKWSAGGKAPAALIARFASEMEELVNDLESWAAVDFAFDFGVLLGPLY